MSSQEKPLQKKAPELALKVVRLYQVMIKEKEFIISKQLLRSGTSVAANQAEAQSAASKKDFIAKLILSAKECRETLCWLNLIKETKLVNVNVDEELKLADEIMALLTSIIKTAQKNQFHGKESIDQGNSE